MLTRKRRRFFAVLSTATLFLAAHGLHSFADDKRAPAPKFSANTTQGVFFGSLNEAIRGQRPQLQALRNVTPAAAGGNMAAAAGQGDDESASGKWDALISPVSLEDEIKRLKLRYDANVNQPGPFKSGGFEDARLDLMMLSSLFAIISEYNGEVRFKDDAAAARDLLARTAFNLNSGSTQAFNEARARKDDLRDLLTGTGLRGRKSEQGNDWVSIADRSPLMEYAEQLSDQLRTATASADDVKAEPSDVRRPAELLAVLGRILQQEGMDEAEDEDYCNLSEAMTQAAKGVTRGLELDDYDAIIKAVGDITQSCDECHGQYR
jgi:hypothetical protein